jgi:pheromone shutdown protein TraB
MGLVSGQTFSWRWFSPLPLLVPGMECPCSVIPDSLNICIIINVVISTTLLLVWIVLLHKWIVFNKIFVTCQPTFRSSATPSSILLTCTSSPFRTISSLPVPPLLASFVNARYLVSPETSSSTPHHDFSR